MRTLGKIVSITAAAVLAFVPDYTDKPEAVMAVTVQKYGEDGKVFDLRTISELRGHVLSSPVPVLLEFGAEWCAPCLKTAPMLDSLAASRGNALRVVKVDIDKDEIKWMQEPGLEDFRIRGIPHFLVVNNGKVVAKRGGAFANTQEMTAWLDAATSPKVVPGAPRP